MHEREDELEAIGASLGQTLYETFPKDRDALGALVMYIATQMADNLHDDLGIVEAAEFFIELNDNAEAMVEEAKTQINKGTIH